MLMFDENEIKNLKFRTILNRILLSPNPDDSKRLFLVSFCRDTLGWNEEQIVRKINYYNKWANYRYEITVRQVNLIFERKADGRLKDFRSKAYGLTETHHKERFSKGETSATHSNCKNENFSPLEFQLVSISHKDNDKGVIDIEEKQVFARVNNGNRWYKVSEKTGQYGNFYSLDSGQLLEVTTDDGSTQIGYGKADRFFSLPKEPEILQKLIDGLQQIMPEKIFKDTRKKK
jgi:hypothetical protein